MTAPLRAAFLLLLILLLAGAAYLIFDITAEGLLAAAIVLGLLAGFATQDVLRNLVGGLVLALRAPFQVGDRISVGNAHGEVIAIGLHTTRIRTPDDCLVAVPNARILNTPVSRVEVGPSDCQVVADLYLPGDVDEAKAKKIAYEAAASSAYVLLEKPIVVHVRDAFRGTPLTHVQIEACARNVSYEPLLVSDITERARHAFRAQGLLHPLHDTPSAAYLTNLPSLEGNGHSSSHRSRPPSHSTGESG